jgi:hypothetical protein
MTTKLSHSKRKLIVLGFLSMIIIEEVAAIVGRPLTPVSVAGAARRTVRRRH